jgi:putative ABC transport system permease protein
VEGANRLVVASRLSITQTLPIRLRERIARCPACAMPPTRWFGGIYRDPKNFFANFSVSPNFFDVYRNCRSRPSNWRLQGRPAPARWSARRWPRFGWKIGDTIPLQATIFPRSGSNDWPLQLKGIYRSKDRARPPTKNAS